MEQEAKPDFPRTIGELRKRLAELGNPWQVNPRFSDDDPLPDPPRGGQSEEEIPEAYRLAPLAADVDVLALIAAQIPANPFLQARWAEMGLINQDQVERLSSETDEGADDFGGAA